MRGAIVHEKTATSLWLDDGMAGAWGRALATARRWQRRQAGRARLRELDDRLLADVGLSRAVAAREAAKPFWQD